MKKKMMCRVFGLAMAAALTACAGGQMAQAAEAPAAVSTETDDRSTLVGGWQVNQGSLSPRDNQEAMTAFNQAAAKQKAYRYQVISVLGEQCVAGTNYSYLCRRQETKPDAELSYVIVNVYQNLKGQSIITGTKELLPYAEKNLEGGWSYNQGRPEMVYNTRVERAFRKSLNGLVGADFEPIAYVGSQVVSGMNYALFCGVTPVIPNGERHFCLVTFHQALDGTAEPLDMEDVDIGLN